MRKPLHPIPEISADFTLEDIRKIRIWNNERSKEMSEEEWIAEINSVGYMVNQEIEALRRKAATDAKAPI